MFQHLSRQAAFLSVPRIAVLAVGIAVGLSLVAGASLVAAQRGEPGNSPAAQSYQGCVNTYTGVLRIVGAGEQCQDHELPIQIGGGGSGSDTALMERVEDLEAENAALQDTVANQQDVIDGLSQQNVDQQGYINDLVQQNTDQQGYIDDLVQQNTDQQTAIEALEPNQVQIPACLTTEEVTGQERDDIVFEGCNVHVRSGAGATDATVNGLGNLIIGYNEGNVNDTRTGSHNVVVGSGHSYSSYGGLVVGLNNTIRGAYSSVSGGILNTSSSYASSVSGGTLNTASGANSSISGGTFNTASGSYSSVSSGFDNTADGAYSSVSGGAYNTASGDKSSVSGGFGRSAPNTFDWRGGEYLSEE